MPANRPSFTNQLLEMWSRLLWPQRLTILFFAFLGLALIGSVVYFVNRLDYQTLYRDIDPEDAQAIIKKLEEKKIDYDIQGSSILVAVPEKEVSKLLIEFAGSNLARSGKIGFEIFDKNQFGMTDFTEQVNLQRAYEGELARTISSLSEIDKAEVHIVLPKDSIFEGSEERAKASVVVFLKPGNELSKSSVAGIKGVIAGAVPGLTTHNVSIVDGEGRFLAQSVESGEGARAEIESGIREQIEREMAGKVVSILEPLVGKNKVHANASITLDFNTTEQTEETYNPNPPAILSQQKSEERSGTSGGPSGIPGTQSNVAMNTAQSPASTLERVRQSELTNYEINKMVRHTIQPKGTVRRLSVAVILDHKTVYDQAKDGKVISHREPRSQKDLESYRQLVLAAVGFDAQRGDVVSIENVPFYAESKPSEPQPAIAWYLRRPAYLSPALKYGSFVVLFFLAYFIIFRPVKNKAIEAMSYVALEQGTGGQELQAPAESAPRALPGAPSSGEISAPASGPAIPKVTSQSNAGAELLSLESVSDEQIERELLKEANAVDLGGRKFAAMKKKLVDKAKKDPEMVSQLIRTLLRERA